MDTMQKPAVPAAACAIFGALLLILALAASPRWPDESVFLQPLSTVVRAAPGHGSILAARLIWLGTGYAFFAFLAGTAMRLRNVPFASCGAILCVLGLALLLELLENLLWLSLYTDDRIAALLGGCCGAWLAKTVSPPGRSAGWRQTACRILSALGASALLAALLGAVLLDLFLPAGLVRYNAVLLPARAVMHGADALPGGEAKRYRREREDLQTQKTRLLSMLAAGSALMETTYGSGVLEVMAQEGMLWIDPDGRWTFGVGHPPAAGDAAASAVEKKRIAAAFLQRFLAPDETLLFSHVDWTTHEWEGEPLPNFHFCVRSDRADRYYLENEMQIVIVNGVPDHIEYTVISGVEAGAVRTISAQEACAYSARFCGEEIPSFPQSDGWSVRSVQRTYVPYRDWLLPAYRITAVGTDAAGQTLTLTTTVDAAERPF